MLNTIVKPVCRYDRVCHGYGGGRGGEEEGGTLYFQKTESTRDLQLTIVVISSHIDLELKILNGD